MNNDTDRHCNDLTQLCSREQLSALMDGALPEDQTRFLLRRLQHDAALASCWERWRTAADVMRGVAPGRCLPADFAGRVATALREDAPLGAAARASARAARHRRWGGGAALAAALGALAILGLPTGEPAAPHPAPALALQRTGAGVPAQPVGAPAPLVPAAPAGTPPAAVDAAASLAVATSVARANRRKASQGEGLGVEAGLPAADQHATPVEFAVTAAPPADVATRPWPRSVLPQYGNAGLTVGFGELPPRAIDAETFRASPTFAHPPKLLKAVEPESGAAPALSPEPAGVHKGKAAAQTDARP